MYDLYFNEDLCYTGVSILFCEQCHKKYNFLCRISWVKKGEIPWWQIITERSKEVWRYQ